MQRTRVGSWTTDSTSGSHGKSSASSVASSDTFEARGSLERSDGGTRYHCPNVSVVRSLTVGNLSVAQICKVKQECCPCLITEITRSRSGVILSIGLFICDCSYRESIFYDPRYNSRLQKTDFICVGSVVDVELMKIPKKPVVIRSEDWQLVECMPGANVISTQMKNGNIIEELELITEASYFLEAQRGPEPKFEECRIGTVLGMYKGTLHEGMYRIKCRLYLTPRCCWKASHAMFIKPLPCESTIRSEDVYKKAPPSPPPTPAQVPRPQPRMTTDKELARMKMEGGGDGYVPREYRCATAKNLMLLMASDERLMKELEQRSGIDYVNEFEPLIEELETSIYTRSKMKKALARTAGMLRCFESNEFASNAMMDLAPEIFKKIKETTHDLRGFVR